jgi:hypothetical protein
VLNEDSVSFRLHGPPVRPASASSRGGSEEVQDPAGEEERARGGDGPSFCRLCGSSYSGGQQWRVNYSYAYRLCGTDNIVVIIGDEQKQFCRKFFFF